MDTHRIHAQLFSGPIHENFFLSFKENAVRLRLDLIDERSFILAHFVWDLPSLHTKEVYLSDLALVDPDKKKKKKGDLAV